MQLTSELSLQNPRLSSMMFVLITLLSGLFLASVVTIENLYLLVLFFVIFTSTGLLVMRDVLRAYLVLIFLFPLLPSVAPQIGLPDFNYHEFLFLSFTFWWSLHGLTGRKTFLSHSLSTYLLLFLILCAASSLLGLLRTNFIFSNVFLFKLFEKWNLFQPWSQLDTVATVRFFMNFAEGILFFFITLDVVKKKENASKALGALFASAVCVSILGILQYAFEYRPIVPWTGQLIRTRVNSTFSDPNSLGTFLSSGLLFGIARYFSVEPKNRWKYALSIGVVLLCLVFTSSRAAWGATCLALVLFLLLVARKGLFASSFQNDRVRAGWIAAVLVVIVLLAGLIVAVSMTGTGLPSAANGSHGYLNSILMGRINVWAAGWKIFTDHPWFGVGPGSFPQYLDDHQESLPTLYMHENAHNYYLQLLAELGWVGTLLFLWIVAISLWHGARVFQQQESMSAEPLSLLAFISAIVVVLTTSVTGHPLLLIKLQYFFWSVLALLWIFLDASSASPVLARNRKKIVAGLVGSVLLLLGPIEAYSILKSRHIFPYEQGFYDWENDSTGLFRWTKDKALSRLRVEGPVLKISLRHISANLVRRPASVDVTLNGRTIDCVTFTVNDWTELRYYLLESRQGDVMTIGLKPDRVFTPSEISTSSDSRDLGIEVRPFEWESNVVKPIGIYNRETHDGRNFVWTTMRASFPLQQGGKILHVPFFYNHPDQKQSLPVSLYWNQVLLKKISIPNRGWQEHSFDIRHSGPGDGILTVVAGRTWNPGKLGLSNDYRELGVGVGDFRWE